MIRRLPAVFALLLAAAPASAATVDIYATANPVFTFFPSTVRIRVGDTVRWTNIDGSHNVQADDGSWGNGVQVAPWTFLHTFTTAGSFGFYCVPHGGPGGTGMSGTVVVTEGAEIAHGSQVEDDLDAVADTYRLGQKAYSSYEVVVDSLAGSPLLQLDRLSAGGTVVSSGVAVSSLDMSQSLRWQNATSSALDTERVRVSNPGCSTNCSTSDRYALRMYETTLSVPRYNQTGTQATVLILQNAADYAMNGRVYFWTGAGALANAGGTAFTVAAKSAFVLSGGGVTGVPGTSGTITVSHDGRYGDLTGKAVAVEPATGFTFDTPAVTHPK
jgi:plastocyanin